LHANRENRIVLVFSMPIALRNLGWKTYIINGSWDIITFFLIVSQHLICSLMKNRSIDIVRLFIGSKQKGRAWRRSTLYLVTSLTQGIT
jgi:hypothetical protein